MSLIDDLGELEVRARGMIEGADGTDALERARVALLGRKGEITSVMHMMGKVAPEERPVLGKRANELRRLTESMIERRGKDLRREALSSLMATEAVDVTLPGARPKLGHQHLISQRRSRTSSAGSATPWRAVRRSRRAGATSPR